MAAPMTPEVFISYARPDEEVASKLRTLLEAEGSPVLDPDDPLHVVTDERRGRVRARQTFRLPRAYWKVMVWIDDRRSVPACFTVVNTEHAETPVERSVPEIERLTGLGFPEILVSSRAGA